MTVLSFARASRYLRTLAALVACGYLASALQVITISAVVLDEFAVLAADYPCAGHDCGCRSAQQCQTNCCCFPKVPTPKPGCCAKEPPAEEPSAPAVIIATGCTGAKAVIDFTVKRLVPVRHKTAVPALVAAAPAAYVLEPDPTFTSTTPEVPSPVPIACS